MVRFSTETAKKTYKIRGEGQGIQRTLVRVVPRGRANDGLAAHQRFLGEGNTERGADGEGVGYVLKIAHRQLVPVCLQVQLQLPAARRSIAKSGKWPMSWLYATAKDKIAS